MKWKLAACRINKGLKQKDVAEDPDRSCEAPVALAHRRIARLLIIFDKMSD